MAKRKKKRKNKGVLDGITLTPDKPLTGKELGLLIAALAGGTLAGVSIPKPWYAAGIPIAILGVVKKNMYITTAGVAIALTGGMKTHLSEAAAVEGIEGIEGVKERLINYFKNFKEGVSFLNKKEEPVGNLGEGEKEKVIYFTNPYNTNQLDSKIDLSPLDRIQEQVEAMSGLASMDISERNF